MTLSARSLERLGGVHPDLVRVVEAAAQHTRFHVTEGVRSLKRQKQLLAEGKSRTLKSRHLVGCAVDLVAVTDDGKVSYDDDRMRAVAAAMKRAAGELGIPIEWGGDWTSFVDTPHFQLPADLYPDAAAPTRVQKPVVEAVKESKTILGALVALAGTLVQWMEQGLGAALEAAAKVAEWTPATTLLETLGANTKAAGFGLAVAGIVLVIMRRVDAAQKGKIG